MLLKSFLKYRFCVGSNRMTQVLYNKIDLSESDKSYIFDIFNHTQ